jgi:hypothetical protein
MLAAAVAVQVQQVGQQVEALFLPAVLDFNGLTVLTMPEAVVLVLKTVLPQVTAAMAAAVEVGSLMYLQLLVQQILVAVAVAEAIQWDIEAERLVAPVL